MALKDIFGFFAIYAVGALALNVVCGCLGEFALGHGGFLLIGYTVAVIVASKMFDMFGGFEFYLDKFTMAEIEELMYGVARDIYKKFRCR